jgi:rod shape-determining protein MreC
MVEHRTKLRWIAAAVAVVLLFFLPDGCTARIKGLLKDTLTPVQHLFLKTGQRLKAGADSVRGLGGLAEENRRLSEEMIHLQARLNVLENLEQENMHLQSQLGFYRQQLTTLIPAEITARTISGWWQSVRLNKGLRDGIGSNRAVISSSGLVGRTAEVSSHTAEVLLISDPACKVSARVSRTGSFGLVSGLGVNLKGYPVARMRFIHKDAPVRTGDAVVTSGLGGVFPKDILIGYIEEVHTEEAGLYQVADLIPNAVIELMDVVFVTMDETGEGDE